MSKKIIDPNLYDEEYYLSDNEGCAEYKKGIDQNIHPKFKRALELVAIKPGYRVIDVGCGRGELVYYCAQRGAEVLGVDYSDAAIKIAQKTMQKLSKEVQKKVIVKVADIAEMELEGLFDCIFMVEIAEHMYDWQLQAAFSRFEKHLKPQGRLIIMTPNFYYEKYLQPLKLFLDIPCRLFKWPLRIFRGKYKPKSIRELLHKIFHIKKDRGEINRQRHGNVMTPRHLKELLNGFDVQMWCEDHSIAPVSLLFKKWWGLEIISIAKPKLDK